MTRTLAETGEDAVVARLVAGLTMGSQVVVGPGDDCAVVRGAGGGRWQLLKADCVVENVHFLRDQPAARVGWKALGRAVSDIAACGGEPAEALITVACPGDLPLRWLEEFYRGVEKLARRFGVSVVGGETARSPGGIFVSVALTGWVERKRLVLRSGGRVGDQLFVTGRLGGSLGGRHLTFVPRVAEARWLTANFHVRAMMDLSDGLGSDLPRMARASSVGFRVDAARIPRVRGVPELGAISDGEDYELLFAVGKRDSDRLEREWRATFPRLKLTRIGEFVPTDAGGSLPPGFAHWGAELSPNCCSGVSVTVGSLFPRRRHPPGIHRRS